jgi:alcohol dehydrogenase (NADP+)
MKTLKLANKDQMSAIGLGTWKARGEEVKTAVKEAIHVGYRHFDTAAVYENESEIGDALAEIFAEGKVKRQEVFITSKLWNNAHEKDRVLPALQDSLKKLQLDYLDLYLIHWPVAFKAEVGFPQKPSDYIPLENCPISETWQQMESAKSLGLARHIGVSNFSVKKLKDLISKVSAKPEVNQVELHPLLQQNKLLEYCNKENIILTAYSPLGSGDRIVAMKGDNEPNLMEINVIRQIAEKNHTTPAQVLIAWHLSRNCSVIPKSANKNHIIANIEAGKLNLDKNDLNQIARLDKNYRFITGKFFEMPGSGYTNIYDE